ncbi:hypothetical protein V5T82_14210 [Magnetovibrio sp. PR-2]|uniref:hypothetical protein n=1 Tax=Magnetovibrio sp. PR-2 TaxID=3120356 RepID=UPI002FCE076A
MCWVAAAPVAAGAVGGTAAATAGTAAATAAASAASTAAISAAAAGAPTLAGSTALITGAGFGSTAAATTAATGAASSFGAFEIASMALSGLGAYMQNKSQNAMMKAQANSMAYNAQREATALALRRYDRENELKHFLAQQRVDAGASGFEITDFNDLFSDTAAEVARDNFTDSFNTQGTIDGLNYSQESLKQESKANTQNNLFDYAIKTTDRFA